MITIKKYILKNHIHNVTIYYNLLIKNIFLFLFNSLILISQQKQNKQTTQNLKPENQIPNKHNVQGG